MTHRMKLSAIGLALCAAGVLGAAAPAWSHGDTQYRDDVARCKSGASGQDLAACLREAGASLMERRHNGLTTPADPQRNIDARCDRLPPDLRRACLIQMSGRGDTTVQGSVKSGGILRETVIQVPPGTPGSIITSPGGNTALPPGAVRPGSMQPSAPIAPPPRY